MIRRMWHGWFAAAALAVDVDWMKQ